MVGRRCSIGEEKNLFREKPPLSSPPFPSGRGAATRAPFAPIISPVLLGNESNRSNFPTVASPDPRAFLLPPFFRSPSPPSFPSSFLLFLFHYPFHRSDYSDDKYRRSAARPKLRSPQLPAPSQVLIFRGDNEDPRARTASSRPSRLLNFPSRNRGGPRGPPLLFRRDEKFMRRDQILMLGRNEFSNFRRASSPPLSFAPLPPRLPFLRLSFASIAYHQTERERKGARPAIFEKGKEIISKTARFERIKDDPA